MFHREEKNPDKIAFEKQVDLLKQFLDRLKNYPSGKTLAICRSQLNIVITFYEKLSGAS